MGNKNKSVTFEYLLNNKDRPNNISKTIRVGKTYPDPAIPAMKPRASVGGEGNVMKLSPLLRPKITRIEPSKYVQIFSNEIFIIFF